MPVYVTDTDKLYAAPTPAGSADTEMDGPRPAVWYVPDRDSGAWVVDDALYERERDRRIKRAKRDLGAIDGAAHSDRSWREHVIAHSADYPDSAVARMQAAEDAAQPLRAYLSELSSAVSPDLPDYDNELAEL